MIFGILWIEKVNKISDVITQVKSFFLKERLFYSASQRHVSTWSSINLLLLEPNNFINEFY
jgi:hypothetical protein